VNTPNLSRYVPHKATLVKTRDVLSIEQDNSVKVSGLTQVQVVGCKVEAWDNADKENAPDRVLSVSGTQENSLTKSENPVKVSKL
jgi:hypothetical protein